MKYLKIENPGVAPSECFTLLGCSTSRYNSNQDVSGQFGSGLKHAVNVLLSRALNPVIYCGNLSLEYFLKPLTVNDDIDIHSFNQVCVKKIGKTEEGRTVNRTEELSWTLDHGSLSWTDVSMACREFLSNAIDRCVKAGNLEKLVVEVVEENQVRAKKGHTRIFLPYSPDVVKFHLEIEKRFLNMEKITPLGVMDKKCRNLNSDGAMIYRKGVLVKETRNNCRSVFDYNLGDELEIDECRNSDEYTILYCASLYVLLKSSYAQKVTFLSQILSDKAPASWEESLTFYGASGVWENCRETIIKHKEEWKKAWQEVAGNKTILLDSPKPEGLLSTKGLRPVYSKSHGWYFIFNNMGLNTGDNLLTEDEKIGRYIKEASDTLIKEVAVVWEWMEKKGLTQDKNKPDIKEFTQDGLTEYGYYKDNTIFINSIVVGNGVLCTAVIFEELVHYVTGLEDYTLKLQQYLFHLIAQYIH